jgi:hypothetical protein
VSSGIATYSISRSILLLCGDDGAAALGCVESRFALDHRLAGSGRATSSTATNLGDGVPFLSSRHVDGRV